MSAALTTPPRISVGELIAFTAAVMALNAFAIDMMLPALGLIGEELGAARDNDRQLIVLAYVFGNGVAQLFFGPLIDRYGRRRTMLFCLAGYAVGCVLSIFAGSFALLLAARGFQGVMTAGTRVAVTAIVRDQCSGRRMAEVMSLAVTVFMAAPMLAPLFGQLVLFVAPWRWIFFVLLVYGAAIMFWTVTRIPETLNEEARGRIRKNSISAGYVAFLRNRQSLGYTLASAVCFGGLMAYLSASEQIFLEIFELGARFPFAFAAIAGALAVATLVNARLVGRYGMRRLSHAAMFGFALSSAAHLAILNYAGENLWIFMTFTAFNFFCIGLIGPNATALAMEPMGERAGAAASVNGFLSTTLAALLGAFIGGRFDGSTTPIVAGFMALGVVAIIIALWVERGRLFGVRQDASAL